MEQNRDPNNQARVGGEVPNYGTPQQPPSQGYVPPELRPMGAPPPTYQSSPYSVPPVVMQDRRQRRTPLVGPLLLIGAGVVFLLINLGLLDEGVWLQLLQLWPLLLIAIGLDLLIGRRNPALSLLIVLVVLGAGVALVYANGGFRSVGNTTQSSLNVPLNGATKADVHMDLGISALNVDGSGTGSSQLATGQLGYFQDQRPPTVDTSQDGDTAVLRLSQPDTHINFWPFFRSSGNLDWTVHLNPQVPMTLDVNTGTGAVDLDLEQLVVTKLSLDAGTGSVTTVLPANAGAPTSASIHGGVGSLDLTVPEGVEAHITVKTGIGSVNVDDRFAKKGDNVYESRGYSGSPKNKLDLEVDAGVGSVNITSR